MESTLAILSRVDLSDSVCLRRFRFWLIVVRFLLVKSNLFLFAQTP